MGVSSRRRTALFAVVVGTAALGLSACTARMDMTIAPAGTYDATLVMRDTTGQVLTDDTDCSQYADPSVLGLDTSAGATVRSVPIGSSDDDRGVGCEVTIEGVTILDADDIQGTDSSPLVVRDGDLYLVSLAGLAADMEADDSGAGGGEAPPGTSAIVDAHLSITFPGAVVDADGGSVSGRTVTWDDPGILADGVRASGYATSGEGLSFMQRYGTWVLAGGALVLVCLVAALAWRRRRTGSWRLWGDPAEARRRAADRYRGRPRTESGKRPGNKPGKKDSGRSAQKKSEQGKVRKKDRGQAGRKGKPEKESDVAEDS